MTNAERLSPLRVRVGDVFIVASEYQPIPQPNRLIVALRNDHCVGVSIYVTKEGKEAIDPTSRGTTMREHIGAIVANWDLERILKAAEVGYSDGFIGELWKEDREYWINEAQKPPILLVDLTQKA